MADDVAGRIRIRAARDHVLHANATLVDRVDLATALSLSSQRLPASRLLLPRSGLERSDFVQWHVSTVFECPHSVVVGGKPDIETESKGSE